jgi:hypothetical protein
MRPARERDCVFAALKLIQYAVSICRLIKPVQEFDLLG